MNSLIQWPSTTDAGKPLSAWTSADYLQRAYRYAAEKSDDLSTQNGSVLVPAGSKSNLIVFGCNHFPPGVKKTEERLTKRPDKYNYTEHAETDAIHIAALRGTPTEGATLYVPWYACCPCARAIIISGITRVVGHLQVMKRTPTRWMDEITAADQMLDEAGVARDYLDGRLFPSSNFQVLFNGELWTP